MVIALLVAACSTGAAGGNGFRATGDPLDLPGPGALAVADGDQFESMLVGVRGKPVVVNVWASWCAPCRAEMPLLERASQRFGDDVAFVGVASKDQRAPAEAFLDEFDVTYPNVLDDAGEIRERLSLRGFPTTYLFDADGEMTATIVGGVNEQQLAAHLEELAVS